MDMEKTLGDIIFRKKGYKAYIILNRPQKLNALTHAMYNTLNGLISEIEEDPEIRVVIMKGNGNVFSSGYDISAEADQANKGFDIIEARAMCKKTNEFRWKIWNSSKPYIAQLEKYCLGGGLSTVMCCDFLIGTEDLKIGEPEITFGAASGFMMMPWVCNLRKVKEVLMTGKRISGTEAAEIGLITKAVPADQVEAEVEALANTMVKMPSNAVALYKAGINHVYNVLGMKDAVENWDDLSILMALSQTEETKMFNQVVSEKGVKAGLKWRDEYFASKL